MHPQVQINYNQYHQPTMPQPSAPFLFPVPQPSAPPLYPMLQPQYYVPYQPQPILTQAIHNQTLNLLSKAAEMSNSILYRNVQNPAPYNSQFVHVQPVAPKAAPTTNYNFDFSDKSWKMFNNETHVHHHHHQGGGNSEKKDDTGTRILVGLIGLVAAGAAAFLLEKQLLKAKKLKQKINLSPI